MELKWEAATVQTSMGAFILQARRAIHSWSFDVRIEMDLVEVWERGRWRGGRLGLGAGTYMEQDDDSRTRTRLQSFGNGLLLEALTLTYFKGHY